MNIEQIECFELIRRKDPITGEMKVSTMNKDRIHHPRLILSDKMCSGLKKKEWETLYLRFVVYQNDNLNQFYKRLLSYDHKVQRKLIDEIELEKQFILKCILCGINIKTKKFEALWNQKAKDQGKDSLYDLFEELERDPVIVDPYWDEKKGELIEYPDGPPRYGNSGMAKPFADELGYTVETKSPWWWPFS